jgi:dTDP-4-dehydrorhamnose reductase
MSKNIAVIGKSGQLANELAQLSSAQHNILCFGRNEIELTNPGSIEALLVEHNITAVINACAYTAVDKAETDIENAFLLNETAVKNLAIVCYKHNCHLVNVSTDYVFKGDKGRPYLPKDEIAPTGIYGKSKLAGEQQLQTILPLNSTSIRTSWVYSIHGHNFVKTMIQLMNTKPELGVIADQIGSPTHAKGLATACLMASEARITGIHHYTDLGVASWYDFALAIQNAGLELGLITQKIPIKPINTEDYPTPAKRPHYSVLDKTSLQKVLPTLNFEHWQQELNNMLNVL